MVRNVKCYTVLLLQVFPARSKGPHHVNGFMVAVKNHWRYNIYLMLVVIFHRFAVVHFVITQFHTIIFINFNKRHYTVVHHHIFSGAIFAQQLDNTLTFAQGISTQHNIGIG
ncbi:hypothetical protein D3C85_1427650 [compost metagenome]